MDACDDGSAATVATAGDGPVPGEDRGHHQRRREEEQCRRRHRRALARDADRPGIAEVAQQCQVSGMMLPTVSGYYVTACCLI